MSDTTPSTPLTRRIGRELAAIRISAGLTQRQISEELGYGQGQVFRIENGKFARLSPVEAYAGLLGYKIGVTITPKEQN